MLDNPLVTIVTPSFNQGEFIEQTILSILNQDYNNIEYIIMDGGSTDNSIDVIKKYESRITYWESKPDKGQTHALNKGFKMANGEYIGWLNSDDWIQPDLVSNICNTFNTNKKVGTVYGYLNIIDNDEKLIEIRENPENSDYFSFLDGKASINQIGAFHRRALLQKFGYLDESLNYVMDYELWLRLGQHSDFFQLPFIVGTHRLHDKTKTKREFHKFVPEIKTVRKIFGGKLFSRKTFHLLRIQLGYLRSKIFGF
jgi:glycosyltransferase involved in cell wall biosynthesis